MSMCPESERREREAEGGLSSFEATEATAGASASFRQRVADPKKAVKKYRRSAAGRDMHRCLLRISLVLDQLRFPFSVYTNFGPLPRSTYLLLVATPMSS